MSRSTEIKKIVTGYDLSAESLVGVEHALRLATQSGAEVVIVHAGQYKPPSTKMPLPETDESHFNELMTQAAPERDAELKAVCQRYNTVPVTKTTINAHPDVGLSIATKELNADLLVVGTHGYTGFRRFLLGSVAEKAVRIVETNVLVARESKVSLEYYGRILVPTDFSQPSVDALELAMTLATKESSIELVHYWQLPYVSTGNFGAVPITGLAAQNLREQTREASIASGQRLVSRYSDRGIPLSFEHQEGQPAQEIHKRLLEEDYDLVVLGSHGRRGLRRLLLGSVAEATLRHAPCSVFMVRASKPEWPPSCGAVDSRQRRPAAPTGSRAARDRKSVV